MSPPASRPRPTKARATASRKAPAPPSRKSDRAGPDSPSRPEVKEGLEILDRMLGFVHGDADARFYEDRWTTLRCANSRLYQPHWESTRAVSLRVAVEGGKLGVAMTTDLSPEGLRAVVEQATSLARVAPPAPGFHGFAKDPGGPTPEIPFSTKVLAHDLEKLGDKIAAAFSIVEENLGPARISGVYNQGYSLLAVANTNGLRRGHRRSAAQASILTELPEKDPPVSGWAEGSHWDPSHVDLTSLAKEAVEATPRTAPKAVGPGKYRVLLMGPAVSELTGHLSWLGLGASSVEEGWSFLTTGTGQKLVSPSFELSDDPFCSEGLPSSIDFEGLPHQVRPVFEDGRAHGPAHDTLTAARAGTTSTKNAMPPEAPFGEMGPLPLHLTMKPGDLDRNELVKELKEGVVVTRFWYVRAVHPGKTIITGMTRDGTYWVENGEIKHPIRNLRFTESILSTLAGVEAVGEQRRCYSDERGYIAPVLAPIVSKEFTFTSATTF